VQNGWLDGVWGGTEKNKELALLASPPPLHCAFALMLTLLTLFFTYVEI